MGCGVSHTQMPAVPEEGGFDLHQIYHKWARHMFTVNGKYKASYQIEVNDEGVRCKAGKTRFDMRPEQKPVTQVIFTGVQHIRNSQDQMEFSFKTERKTKSVASIHLTQNLVQNGQGLGLKFEYPPLDACSGFGRGTVLTGETRQTEEQELVWAVDNVIRANSCGKRSVDLCVDEKRVAGSFAIEVAFRGSLIANLWDISSGKKILVSTATERAENVLINMADFTKGGEDERQWAKFTMKGSCEFAFVIKQHVVVHDVEETEEMSDSEPETELYDV